MIGEYFLMKHIAKKIILFVIFILFIIYFISCLPIYIHMNYLSYPEKIMPALAIKIHDSIIIPNPLIKKYYYFMLFKIPEWTMPVAVMINGGNMYFGGKQFKKKWWYYVILVISILMSLILMDCWWILDTVE